MTPNQPAPSAASKPRILCVDDESQILDALSLNLGRRYEVLTATSGEAGLNLLAARSDVAAIISDMRMPAMDGAAFLARSRQFAPDAARILLTGQADLFSAIAAVNEGQIFRFLSKPCPPPTLLTAVKAAITQYQLVTSERVLLEETLHGSIKALTDILALTNPISFGRADRVKRLCTKIAERQRLEQRWQLEVAAMFSHLGSITLPDEVAHKLYYGQRLSAGEWDMVNRSKSVAVKLTAHIPRLEAVREILAIGCRVSEPTRVLDPFIGKASSILRAALEFDSCETRGIQGQKAVEALRLAVPAHDQSVLDDLERIFAGRDTSPAPGAKHAHFDVAGDAGGSLAGAAEISDGVRDIPAGALRPGMILAEDITTTAGLLLAASGFEVTPSFVERLSNFEGQLSRHAFRIAFGSHGR